MINRLITGILVVLLLFSGGMSYYTYQLNQRVNTLSTQLASWRQQQADQLSAISDDLATASGETTARLDNVEAAINSSQSQIEALDDELSDTRNGVGSLERGLDEALGRINGIEDTAADTSAELSRLALTTIDAPQVYQAVSRATVSISNGKNTIGSGFIFDSETHVLTACHVVDNLSDIYIIFPDGTTSPATITGRSEPSDIAVLEVATGVAVAPPRLADSSRIRIGEPVVAIGSPFELTGTLTAGVVSQVNRWVEITGGTKSHWVANLIQFDAPANFGNSGCPLVNAQGEVIGLVIARINPGEGDGIYYAVAANKIKRVAAALIEGGSFSYPWLGISMVNLTPQIAQTKKLGTINGILVTGLPAASPARTAGVIVDDIIVAIDGINTGEAADLTAYLGEYKSPGDPATLTIIRGGSKIELPVTIGEPPS